MKKELKKGEAEERTKALDKEEALAKVLYTYSYFEKISINYISDNKEDKDDSQKVEFSPLEIEDEITVENMNESEILKMIQQKTETYKGQF